MRKNIREANFAILAEMYDFRPILSRKFVSAIFLNTSCSDNLCVIVYLLIQIKRLSVVELC